ncbi:uncharacterized protein LOC108734475 [Agrilus planipennis]|uniref:Uncharacterized protein LOC108734475 n=1 Tax=Agrilus planipennis TaxID=224129 RepID=A0A7F5RHE0_AGRPL|nr:uncharacterized protein LOC108734475 [Agrilus planipennis]
MATDTPGVKPMSIAGRFVRERERLFGMTDEDRMLRKQWLKDQELAHNEPLENPKMYKFRHNFIRRIYRAPLNTLGAILKPILGKKRAMKIRYFSGKIIIGIILLEAATYYFKYNSHSWIRKGGWRVLKSRVSVLPGDPCYPDASCKGCYADFGFLKNTVKLK